MARAGEGCVYKCSHYFVRLLEGVCLDGERTQWPQWYLHSTCSNKEIWPCVSLNLTPDLSRGSLITSDVPHLWPLALHVQTSEVVPGKMGHFNTVSNTSREGFSSVESMAGVWNALCRLLEGGVDTDARA